MRDYHRLEVWQLAHQLTLDVYRLTDTFPKTEQYGLTSQLRRSSVSIGSNIAEGCGRQSRVEYARFLEIALGSVNEAEYQILLAADLEFLDAGRAGPLAAGCDTTRRKLIRLRERVLATNT